MAFLADKMWSLNLSSGVEIPAYPEEASPGRRYCPQDTSQRGCVGSGCFPVAVGGGFVFSRPEERRRSCMLSATGRWDRVWAA